MKSTGICATCYETRAQNIVETAFKDKGSKIQYKGTTGVAEKGNRTMRLLFGALVDYQKFEFDLSKRSEETVVNLKKASSGISGGLIGASQAEKAYNTIVKNVESKFQQNGVQVRVE